MVNRYLGVKQFLGESTIFHVTVALSVSVRVCVCMHVIFMITGLCLGEKNLKKKFLWVLMIFAIEWRHCKCYTL